MNLDISKFKLPEVFNDSNGKTDPSLVAGFLGCITALLGFILAGSCIVIMLVMKIEKDVNVINFLQGITNQCIALFTLGGGMLGIHRLSKDKKITDSNELPQ